MLAVKILVPAKLKQQPLFKQHLMPYFLNASPLIRYGIAFIAVSFMIFAIRFMPGIGEWKKGGLLLPFFAMTAVTFWLGRNPGLLSALFSVLLINKTNLLHVWMENPKEAILINTVFILLSVLTIASISYQEKLLKRLSDSQQDLHLAQSVGKMGNWRIDLNTHQITWSDEIFQIFEIPADTRITYDIFLNSVHPEDRAYVAQQWQAALQGHAYDIEHRILVNGKVKWIHEKAVMDFSQDGVITSGFGIAQDISNQKKAEKELYEQENQLRLIMNLTPTLISYVNKDMRYDRINRTYEDWWHIRPDQILGRTVREVVGEKSWPIIQPYVEKVLSGERVSYDQQLTFYNNTLRWVNATYMPDMDEKGYVKGFVAHITDIEDRMRKEKSLLEAEARMRLATEATGVGIWEWNVKTGQIRWDQQMFRMYGIAPSHDRTIFYDRWCDSLLPEDLQQAQELGKTAIRTAGYYAGEFRIRKSDDHTIRTIQTCITSRLNYQGEVEWLLGTNLDITERKAAEIALIEQDKQLQLIMNLTPALIGYVDTGFRHEKINKTYQEWFGLDPAEIIGHTVREIIGEKAWAIAEPGFIRARQGQKVNFDNRFKFHDKAVRWVQVNLTPDTDSNGQVKGILIHVANIDDRKKAENHIARLNESLWKKIKELQLIFDTVPIGLAITHDTRGMDIQGNKVLENMIGISGLNEHSFNSISPQSYQVYEKNSKLSVDELPMQRAARGDPVNNQLLEIKRADGDLIIVLANANPIMDADGTVLGAVGAFQDITKLKQIQESFLKSHRQLQTLVEQATIGIAMFDRDMNYLITSKRWLKDFGQGYSNLTGLNHYTVHADIPDSCKQYYQLALAGVPSKKESDLWVLGDGAKHWVSWSMGPWTTIDGEIGGIIICCDNITEQKLAEEKLRASEIRVALALDELKAGF